MFYWNISAFFWLENKISGQIENNSEWFDRSSEKILLILSGENEMELKKSLMKGLSEFATV